MVFVDTSLCTGCKGCSAACKEWNELPAEKTSLVHMDYQTMTDFTPNTWTYMTFNEEYENNKFTWLIRKAQCFHCTNPACLKGCPAGAISKKEQGNVVIDQDRCIGCGYCNENCPFGVPKLDKAKMKSFKCTGCIDRVEAGLKPACVQVCQPGTLQFGDEADMKAAAQKRLDEVKANHPNAMIYGLKEMGGTNWIYLLLDTPDKYGLPTNPQLPASLTVWKDVVRPVGAVAAGAALAAVAVGAVINVGKGTYKKDSDELLAEHIAHAAHAQELAQAKAKAKSHPHSSDKGEKM